jgi:C4-dicarboxylate-specific signal transduction histidine kinase
MLSIMLTILRQHGSIFVERDGDALVIRVSDRGPGFAPQMLAQFGKPYQSSNGRPGGGLGLFLVVNVVRKLGGASRHPTIPKAAHR